jgi:hypothetical protein
MSEWKPKVEDVVVELLLLKVIRGIEFNHLFHSDLVLDLAL